MQVREGEEMCFYQHLLYSVNNNGNSGKYKKMIYKNASNLTFLIKRFAGANRRDIKILLD